VCEKYWDCLDNIGSHPDFGDESEVTKTCMGQFSAALVGMDLSNFVPPVGAEAKQSCVDMAQEAAISRLCISQDAYDFWDLHRISADTGSGAAPQEAAISRLCISQLHHV
jgi:hypothetical protein